MSCVEEGLAAIAEGSSVESLSRRVLAAPARSKSRVYDNTYKGSVRTRCHIKESLN